MDNTHDLTEKEVQKIFDAVSTIKKLAKYIERINAENVLLRKNLEESIKAGDVTNEQKVKLMCYADAEKEYERRLEIIKAKCPENCKCETEKHDGCPIYQEFVVASWMRGVAHGSRFDWDFIFEDAVIGHLKRMKGYMKNANRGLG